MIPAHNITEWRENAPWKTEAQVEQDLVLSRAVIELYSDPLLRKELTMRGGTALQKLYFTKAQRYSEDIDLVRSHPGPAKKIMDAIRERLSWLGKPSTNQKQGRITLVFRFKSETEPVVPLRLKVEINTVDGDPAMPLKAVPLSVKNRWFSGTSEIVTYQLEELLGTKLRALYQRRKGRDLFDLHRALDKFPDLNRKQVVHCLGHYLKIQGLRVSRAQFESNLIEKSSSRRFQEDILPLLTEEAGFDFEEAVEQVQANLISLLAGKPWKGSLVEAP